MRKFLFPVLIGILLLVLTDWYFIANEILAYQEKMQILAVMTAGEETDSMETAAELLKGTTLALGKADRKKLETYASLEETGQEKLKSYGYLEGQENYFSLQMKASIRNIIVFSIIAFLAYLLSLFWLSKQCDNQRKQELRNFSQVLNQFSNHIYEINLPERLNDGETEINRIEGQLTSLSEQLRHNEERLELEKEETRSLVTDISHQLKTPVAGLKACFEILSQGDLNQEEEKEFLEQCTRQLKGLEALVGALVNISRMETGMIQIRREPADILETLVTAVNRVYLKAEEKQIAIEFEESEDLAAILIPHDVKWLCEAFINILENAVKYSPGNTKIHIRMIKLTTFLRIEIEDQGIGIPREAYHKIFKRFYRGEAREIRQAEGSGVGLYLTREILERHGGSVTVASKYGKKQQGSTFVVQIPYGDEGRE